MLLRKFRNVGFEDVQVRERQAFGLLELRRYPLFAPDFIEFLARVMPPARHAELVFSIVVTARRPLPEPARRGAEESWRVMTDTR